MPPSDTAKLSASGDIALPATLLARRGWRPGQAFTLVARDEGLLLVPVSDRDSLAGIAKGANPDDHHDRDDRY